MGDRREQRQPAPENRAQHDDQLARIAIRQRPHKRRGDHVKAQKRAGEISDLRLAEMKFILHQRLHRKQHIAIRIIQQIERGEHEQRGSGMELLLGHEVERI